jgi:hypothetical protein
VTARERTCVAHLVRASNGLPAFERFLASYLAHDAGAPHRLLLILKGFRDAASLAPYDRLTAGVPHDRLHVRDVGYDIRPYVVTARRTSFARYCFLNSFSVILAPDWLAKLEAHARPGAHCLAGATGSWESHLSTVLADRAFGTRIPLVGGGHLPCPRAVAVAARAARIWSWRRRYDPFPNPHVRTNAFLVTRDLLLRSAPRLLLTKADAWAFESARTGLSRTAAACGAPLLVVGRDGNAYEPDAWPDSNTFWQRGQQNLLVADNQTRRYDAADAPTRDAMARSAWAERAVVEAAAERTREA